MERASFTELRSRFARWRTWQVERRNMTSQCATVIVRQYDIHEVREYGVWHTTVHAESQGNVTIWENDQRASGSMKIFRELPRTLYCHTAVALVHLIATRNRGHLCDRTRYGNMRLSTSGFRLTSASALRCGRIPPRISLHLVHFQEYLRR